LLVYDARVVLATSSGRRQVPVDKLFVGPGQVDIKPAEILERVILPAPHERTVSAYSRLSARSEVDMAAAGVASCLVLDEDGRIASARLAMSAVAPTPVRCPEAEQMLVGQLPEPAVLERCARACADAARPIDDVRASAAYRRAIVPVLARRALESCLAGGRGRTT
jgi:carbon-monoxide dehydrogenase medium subunit